MLERFGGARAIDMWDWVDVDDNRRRIRYETQRKQWQYVNVHKAYVDAAVNTFSGAVHDAFLHFATTTQPGEPDPFAGFPGALATEIKTV